MTYAANLNEEVINSQYLAVLKPRRFVQSFTLVSGTIYSSSFDYGQVVSAKNLDTDLTEHTSAAVSSGQWFYDVDTSILYVNIGGAIAVNTILVTYEIYIATFDAHFYRVPTDNTTRSVYFEPLIVKSPLLKDMLNQTYFGVLATLSSQLVVSNATRFLQKHIYDSSFNNADIGLYHYLGNLQTDNVKLLLGGKMSDISSTENEVTIRVFSANVVFQQDFRNEKLSGVVTNFYVDSKFPNLDPDFEGRPVRKVYGRVEGFVPVNVSYVKESPTTSDNRFWLCTPIEPGGSLVAALVPASPSSTTTRTYITQSYERFKVGDTVWIDSVAGPSFDASVEVTGVGSDYIDHAVIGTAAGTSSLVKRAFVSRVEILKADGTTALALFNKHYSIYIDNTYKVMGFEFDSGMEADLGISTLSADDVVYCRIYGGVNDNTIGGSPFGSDSNTYGNMCNAAVVVYDILRNHVGVPESSINTASFQDAGYVELVGFAIPELSTREFPTYRDLFAKLSLNMMARFSLDDDNKWKLQRTAPLGASVKTIEDDEILNKTPTFYFNYQDIITDVVIEYGMREVVVKAGTYSTRPSTLVLSSSVMKRLHNQEKQQTFNTLLADSTNAGVLATKLVSAISDRQGSLRIITRHRFFDSEIGDVITINRSRLPGFEFTDGVDQTRDYVIISKEKSLNQITLELDDQKGVEDNPGGF